MLADAPMQFNVETDEKKKKQKYGKTSRNSLFASKIDELVTNDERKKREQITTGRLLIKSSNYVQMTC